MLPELDRAILRAASQAAAAQPTPFYLFDPKQLRRTASAWRRAARAIGGEIFYPYKCNRAVGVVEPLAAEGFGAEVTTLADFETARRLGLGGERIVIHGPAKSVELVEAGLGYGAILAADGREDSFAILARARQMAKRPRMLLRLAPKAAAPEQRSFGLPAREVVALAREIVRRREALPEGLAFHLDTRIPTPVPYRAALRETASVARELGLLGIPTTILDLGGGFAAESESRLDGSGGPSPAGGGPAMLAPIGAQARRLFGRNPRLFLEPGRALVSGSFHLVARVVRIKEGRRGVTAYLDASRLSHGFWVAMGRHPIAPTPRRRGETRPVQLAGPLGVGHDVFARVRLPPLEPSDLVVIGSVGAYNQNSANTWAGPIPPVVSL